MPLDGDVFFQTLAELNARLRAKEFSCRELANAFLDRMERLGPRYNAIALSLRESAIRKAREVDDEINRGRLRGPLQGVPYGAKDLLAVANQPTTWGAKPYAAQVFSEDAVVIRKLGKAGAVLTGKLAMVELAGGGGYRFPAASLTGPGLNPWKRTHWAGGSSSGSGAAVAAGLVNWAVGSETWGSILTPAAFCGVTGLRPTYGLVSRRGAMALSWTMDKIGPLCRSAEDCGLVLQEIAGGDREDPGSAGKSFYYAPQYQRKLDQIRVGYATSDFEESAEEPARPAFRAALDAVRGLGVKLVEVKLPELPYSATAGTIVSAEGSAVFEPLVESGRVNELADARQIAGLKAGLDISAKDYLKAMRIRRMVQDEMRKVFVDVDILLSPSRFGPASRIDEPLDRPGPGRNRNPPDYPSRGLSDLGAAGNLAGLPALSLPCGFADGLPVAIQLVSRPFTENLLLIAGIAFQKATDWHRRRPPE